MTRSFSSRAVALIAAGLVLAALAASGAAAQGAYVVTDRFGYSGTIERYDSFADLVAGVNAVTGSPFSVPARDLGLYVLDGNPAGPDGPVFANTAIFISAWWYASGATPSNQNTGFIQMYDIEGGSVSSIQARWLDQARTVFDFSLHGGNTVPGCSVMSPDNQDCGRLWNSGSPLGSSATTAGVFHSYAVSFTAAGLSPAAWNATTGVYESASDPTAVTGSLAGIFHNTSTEDPGSNGWYKYDLAIDMNSWAFDNGYLEADASLFGSAEVVPEPATLLLLFTGLAGVVGVAYRRRDDEDEEA